MRFLTHEKWKARQEAMWGRFLEWHLWFAWRPVQIENDTWVWLETVERQRYVGRSTKVSYWLYRPRNGDQP